MFHGRINLGSLFEPRIDEEPLLLVGQRPAECPLGQASAELDRAFFRSSGLVCWVLRLSPLRFPSPSPTLRRSSRRGMPSNSSK